MTETLVERLRKVIGDIPPHNHVPLAQEAASEITRLTAALAEAEGLVNSLKDPVVVHLNMIRGGIAMPSWNQIKHLYIGEYTTAIGDAITTANARIAELTGCLEECVSQNEACWLNHYGENPEGGSTPEYIVRARSVLKEARDG